MKNISSLNPAIMDNAECLIVKVHAPIINQKVGMSLSHNVSLCFNSSYFKHFKNISSKE